MSGAPFGPEGEFVVALEAAAETATWLYDKIPLIKAYRDGPKSLEELQGDVGKPGKGYDVHHIVEQTPARDHEIPDALIDGPDNLVLIPRLKHWEITGWFMTKDRDFDYRPPREYLKGESWEERRRVGIDALIRFQGVEAMRQADLKSMTVDQLVDRFAEIGVAQDQALLYDEIGKFNRLFDQMHLVDIELRARGLAARLALLRLFDNQNMQVRLQAAKWSLGVAPEAARQVIESISESNWFPQAGDAGMTLSNLDLGIFKPD